MFIHRALSSSRTLFHNGTWSVGPDLTRSQLVLYTHRPSTQSTGHDSSSCTVCCVMRCVLPPPPGTLATSSILLLLYVTTGGSYIHIRPSRTTSYQHPAPALLCLSPYYVRLWAVACSIAIQQYCCYGMLLLTLLSSTGCHSPFITSSGREHHERLCTHLGSE